MKHSTSEPVSQPGALEHTSVKQTWRSGNMLYPLPAVMVSCGRYSGNADTSQSNILTVAWCGTVCSDPAMVFISVRPSRYSHDIIRDSGEFVINLTNEKLVAAADMSGVLSGRDVDKFRRCALTPEKAEQVRCPLIAESPVNIECRVTQMIPLGSHDMFLAKVLCVHVDESLLDGKGRLALEKAHLITYSHGTYQALGKALGTFGFSVRKKR